MSLDDQEEAQVAGQLAAYEDGVARAVAKLKEHGDVDTAVQILGAADARVHRNAMPELSGPDHAEIGRQLLAILDSDLPDHEAWREVAALGVIAAARIIDAEAHRGREAG